MTSLPEGSEVEMPLPLCFKVEDRSLREVVESLTHIPYAVTGSLAADPGNPAPRRHGVLAPLRLQLCVKVTPGCGCAWICLIHVCLGTQALVRACVESGFA